jgi:hypothetical protein
VLSFELALFAAIRAGLLGRLGLSGGGNSSVWGWHMPVVLSMGVEVPAGPGVTLVASDRRAVRSLFTIERRRDFVPTFRACECVGRTGRGVRPGPGRATALRPGTSSGSRGFARY